MTPRVEDRDLVEFLEKNNAEIIGENEKYLPYDAFIMGAAGNYFRWDMALGYEQDGPGHRHNDFG